MRVHIRLLGGFDVTVDDHPVPATAWRRKSAASLVKLLALQPDHRLLRDQVIDVLWPDLLLEEALPRLHTAAHYARTALDCRDAVVLTGGSVALFPDAEVTLDVADFDRAADAALAGGGPDAAEDAVARYTGALLPDDLYEPWTEEARERLAFRRLELLRAAGRFEDLVALDPLDEEAHVGLVRTHVAAGRRQAALRALDRMAEVFDRELGVEPGPVSERLRVEAEALPVDPVVPTRRVGPRAPLPAERTRLVGRVADLDAVTTLLGDHRIVTITGPGGAGKSTLALALARGIASDEAGVEVILAELAPVGDGPGVVRAVAEAAGIEGTGSVQAAALAANLASRELLLVLDNCEHLLDASAGLVDALLDAGPRARILVTSREPLRVDGEAVHRIGSLGPDSAELFVERANAAAGPGAASVEDPRVIELCERLDGLPLAIELAAAQLAHLGLTELVAAVDDRLTLLVGGRPKAGHRHSALTATIEWSHRLLDEDARELFARLGVFPASFDLAAVRAVAGEAGGAGVTSLLGDLVAKSLVVHDPDRQRYRLLESIRLFAASRLDGSGRRAEVTELLRRHVAQRAGALPRVRVWLSTSLAATSRDDLDNVRLAFEESLAADDLPAAVDIALGLSTLWRNASSYAEGRHWVASLEAQDLAPRDRMWTSILAADVGLGSGDPRMIREAVGHAAAVEAPTEAAAHVITTIYDGMAHIIRPGLAVERFEEARDRARAAGEPGLERLARAFRMVALLLLGRTDGLDAEARALTGPDPVADYDRYLALWAASLVAVAERDGARQRELMDAQVADLASSGLRENWLTLYWEALALIGEGADHLPQLRRARQRAEAEGRDAEADCVLALAYAAACRDEWERAAELLGAAAGLQRDTAGFLHLVLLRDRLVRPRLDPDVFGSATARGQGLVLEEVLAEHGL